MPNEASFCTRCGASFVVPQKIKVLLADATMPRRGGIGEDPPVLSLLPAPSNSPKRRSAMNCSRFPGTGLFRSAAPKSENRSARTPERAPPSTKSQCYICNSGCDALVFEKDGRVIRVEGDPSSAITKGTLCCKGLASKEQLYHEDRLLYPLKRIGERGERPVAEDLLGRGAGHGRREVQGAGGEVRPGQHRPGHGDQAGDLVRLLHAVRQCLGKAVHLHRLGPVRRSPAVGRPDDAGGNGGRVPGLLPVAVPPRLGSEPRQQLAPPRPRDDGGVVRGRPADRRGFGTPGDPGEGRYLAAAPAGNRFGPGARAF